MKKEDILKLSRQENAKGDEREKKIRSRANILAMNVIYIMAIIFIIANQYLDRKVGIISVISYALTIWIAVDFVKDTYRFIVTREKGRLALAVFYFVLLLLCLFI